MLGGFLDDYPIMKRPIIHLHGDAEIIVIDHTVRIEDRNKQLRRGLSSRVGYIRTDRYTDIVYFMTSGTMLREKLLTSFHIGRQF